MTVELRVLDDPAAAAGELLAEAAMAGAQLACCGGTAVGRAYESAAARRPRWRDVHVWFGDDRAVPPDDEHSNFRLVRETLLAGLEEQPEVHRVLGERPAEEAAALYDAELDGVRLDVSLNGIGPDGHTASLFPHAPALQEVRRRAVAVEARLEPMVPRVTLTPPMFAATGLLVYLVIGEAKAEVVRRAFAEEPDAAIPASLVRGRETLALLDPAAAAQLDG